MVRDKIAYLTCYESKTHWRSVYNDLAYFEGAKSRGSELGYDVEPIWSMEPNMRAERMSKILRARAIRGVILEPAAVSHSRMKLIPSEFAIVAIGDSFEVANINRVSHNHYSGMRLALENLLHGDYQSIAYVNTREQDDRVFNEWNSAFRYMMSSKGKARLIEPFVPDEWNDEHFVAWYRDKQPDAILCNVSAPHRALRSAGIDFAANTTFYSLDANATAKDLPNVNGVDQCAEEVGVAAIELLIWMLNAHNYGPQAKPRYLRVEGSWNA
ncbi:hypothetical protein GCM10007047_33550 [Cerasicoccus arenae]|uniref:LacI family transcriptional regulator n=2 Tax=Cerasicoccus arenae TaxID=424488 RepID=A0A8J3DKW4_9BACT|nr:hypothetical protein GCM10007047_33550 [Cerasicoccus arenae]